LDAQKTRFRSLDAWFRSAQGVEVGHFFTSELNHLKDLLRGEVLLQLGGELSWLHDLHFNHKWCAAPYLNQSSTVITAFNQLPLERNSVDCIVAPLVMEAFTKSDSPIDEIDRVLKPMGHVIFFGVTPLSLWGFAIQLRRLSCYGHLAAKPRSLLLLKRAFLHRGYVQCHLSTFYYIPPLSSKKWMDKLNVLNELGKIISPAPAGFYCLVLQKYQAIQPNFILNPLNNTAWNGNGSLQPAARAF
jgi:hypothetical protein